jgi:hypothetical protein
MLTPPRFCRLLIDFDAGRLDSTVFSSILMLACSILPSPARSGRGRWWLLAVELSAEQLREGKQRGGGKQSSTSGEGRAKQSSASGGGGIAVGRTREREGSDGA